MLKTYGFILHFGEITMIDWKMKPFEWRCISYWKSTCALKILKRTWIIFQPSFFRGKLLVFRGVISYWKWWYSLSYFTASHHPAPFFYTSTNSLRQWLGFENFQGFKIFSRKNMDKSPVWRAAKILLKFFSRRRPQTGKSIQQRKNVMFFFDRWPDFFQVVKAVKDTM